ncbi:hypothetical protein [Fusobacterium sp.]|uniref:hypothetical protein n=1 Tax=Fusobacterium sp. TaxID=68766 RepID=UPI00396C3B8B
MLMLSVFLFIGIFVALTYGIELILPPFGHLFYTDILDILYSLSQTLCYKTSVPEKYCFVFTIFVISIVPFIITLFLNMALKKRKKGSCKYKI